MFSVSQLRFSSFSYLFSCFLMSWSNLFILFFNSYETIPNHFHEIVKTLYSPPINVIRYRSASLPRNYENHKIQKCNCNNATLLTLSAGRCSSCRWVSQTTYQRSQSLQCVSKSNRVQQDRTRLFFLLCVIFQIFSLFVAHFDFDSWLPHAITWVFMLCKFHFLLVQVVIILNEARGCNVFLTAC